MSTTQTSAWKDLLPGVIAAGLLAAAERFLLETSSLAVPFAGSLAASTVYFADHRVRPNGKATPTTWAIILLSSAVLLWSVTQSEKFDLIRTGLFFFLSLAYVLNLPGTKTRLQDHPWLRVIMVALGWGCIPLILKGIPLDVRTLGFVVGTTGLFFSTVFWSDLNDQQEDLKQARVTPVQFLSSKHTHRLIFLGYGGCIIGYLVVGVALLSLPAFTGLLLMLLKKNDVLIRWADVLLLWPGVVALASQWI